ncbi:unnamed protein product [Rotaria socialis]|uniref:EF-hand domain-containing protein n=1 Tax=Rotaria socialis TaxID=392032 RepID=A0A820NQA0_9BILA|nr:unnamed protein product [Rotaria socialis]
MGHKKSKLYHHPQVEKSYTTLTMSQIRYICRHTNLIDKEVCRRHDQFLKMSEDGLLTMGQFTSILQAIWPTGNVNEFADYVFNLYDKDKQGFLEFTEFIILNCQLNNGEMEDLLFHQFYRGCLFDMIDTHHKGLLSREKIEPLFMALFKLIGHSTNEQNGTSISQRHIVHLLQVIDESKNKCLSRNQFINIGNTIWTDEDNGIGVLLAEHPC